MALVQHIEVLQLIIDRLRADATGGGPGSLQDLYSDPPNQIANHLPQDRPLPAMRVRWSPDGPHDRKDGHGYDGRVIVDHWTDQHGDKQVLLSAQRVDLLFHNAPLALADGQNPLLQHRSTVTMLEPDGVTHHVTQTFQLLATST